MQHRASLQLWVRRRTVRDPREIRGDRSGQHHAVQLAIGDTSVAAMISRLSSRQFDVAEAAFGGVDVLVNYAGIMPLADTDDATFERLIGVKLKGTLTR